MKLSRTLPVIGVTLLVVALVVIVAGALTGIVAKETIGLACFILVGTTILSAIVYERLNKCRIHKHLNSRPQLSDDQFRTRFYSQDRERGDIAVRVRRVLASNLKLALEGLQPEDQLEEHLQADLAANPDLFWELEAEFSVSTDVEDLDSHEQSLTRLVTFDDLVDYVAMRIREKPAASKADEPVTPTRFNQFCDRALRCIPFLCVTGFVVVVIGALTRNSILMKLGTALFLSGFAVWGLVNGGGLCWTLLGAVRERGLRATLAHPGIVLPLLGLGVFLLAIGATFVWGILKSLLQGK